MTPDARFDALRAWLERALPVPMRDIAPASSDASFRRYFRVTLDGAFATTGAATHAQTLIAMDAPPPQEDCRPFVAIARLLTDAGVHAPAVYAQDLAQGFLLLSDLGTETYVEALSEQSAPLLYRDATAALLRWQLASRDGVLPRYDETLLRRELDLFPQWYVARQLGIALTDAQRDTLSRAFERILANNLAQPCVYVHRDYHSRNLMVSQPNPGVLDFQDAVYGPVTYDLVSLLRDAYVEWSEEQQLDWTIRYWEGARAAGLPLTADFGAFWRDFEWMGVQRQLKVLGIFARLVPPRRQGRLSGLHAARHALPARRLRALSRARRIAAIARRARSASDLGRVHLLIARTKT